VSFLEDRAWGGAAIIALLFSVSSRGAGAQEASDPGFQLHGDLGLAHAVGNPQASEYGFGGQVGAAGELTFRKVVGLQVELSFLGLSDGSPPSNPALANHGAGYDFDVMGGVRLHPFGQRSVAGLWLDGNFGVALTGNDARPTVDTHVGYDFRVGKGRLDVGPFVGYTQIFQSNDALRPEDAHVVFGGVHVALGAPLPPTALVRTDRDHDGIFDDEDACPDEPGVRTSDPRTNGCPRRDRDGDGVFDDEDACPEVPGIRTDDPKTNGCPRPDRDHDGVFDDEDACPDVPGVRTKNPTTNGCPRGDRDNDTVFDDEDACPDVPGVRTEDPKTNGCPMAGDQVRMVGDKIVLDDIIHFDTDSPRIRHASWPICKKVADFIVANPDVLEVDIEGHADESGTSEHNLVLSRNRADAVKRLVVQFGVDPKRITTHAYGESRPKVAGHAEEQLRQNRRVEFTVTRSRARATELKPKDTPSVPAIAPFVPPPPTPGTNP
jgi:outer membrane protein OmpA-like peptidoglycan-associated protein